MLSIIICSVRPDDLLRVTQNLEITAGLHYELLIWDNRTDNLGLCEVYNKMAAKAQYEYLLFIHEDILFENKNWATGLVNVFQNDPSVGVIGIAGSKYKAKAFSGWYTGIPGMDFINITHRYPSFDEKQCIKPQGQSNFEDVVCTDGVFIACRKDIWQQIRFDAVNLRGFHFYDIDFSLRAASVSRVVVWYGAEIVHITHGGDFGDKWVEIALNYHHLHKDNLPYCKETGTITYAEGKVITTWLDFLKNSRISIRNKWKWIVRQKLYWKPSLYLHIIRFLVYRPLGLKAFKKSKK